MFKRKSVLTKVLSIFLICAFSLAMVIPSAEFAYAKGDDDDGPKPTPENNGIDNTIYEEDGYTVSNRNELKEYAITIETLLMAGDEVEEIFIGYYDTKGYPRYKRIGPHDYYVDNEKYPFSSDVDVYDEMGYCKYFNMYYGSYSNILYNSYWGDANSFTFANEFFGDTYNSITEESLFESNSSTSLFFSSDDAINDVFSISIFMNGGDEVFNMKSCKLYEVTSRDNIYMYSDISTHPYVNFEGKVIYSVEKMYYDGLTVNLQKPVVGNGTPDAQCFTFFADQIKNFDYRILCDAWTYNGQIYGWCPWDEIGCLHREINYRGEEYLLEKDFPNWQDYPVTENFAGGGTIYNKTYDDDNLNYFFSQLYKKGNKYYQAKGRVKVSTGTQTINHYSDPYIKKNTSKNVQNAVFDSDLNTFTVALTFADKYAAGLNALIKGINDKKIDFSEMLYATVTYARNDGSSYSIEIPVITNSLFKYLKSSPSYTAYEVVGSRGVVADDVMLDEYGNIIHQGLVPNPPIAEGGISDDVGPAKAVDEAGFTIPEEYLPKGGLMQLDEAIKNCDDATQALNVLQGGTAGNSQLEQLYLPLKVYLLGIIAQENENNSAGEAEEFTPFPMEVENIYNSPAMYESDQEPDTANGMSYTPMDDSDVSLNKKGLKLFTPLVAYAEDKTPINRIQDTNLSDFTDIINKHTLGSTYQTLDTYKNLTEGEVYSYGQQGDTICFDLNLPNCAKITDMKFSYRSKYNKGIEREEISILGAKIYNKNNVKIDYSTDGTLDATVTGTPLYSYATATSAGLNIITNSNATVSFKEGDLDFADISYANMYLVRLTTDTMVPSGTNDNVKISFQYTDTNGNELTTSEYSVGDYIDDYFGYWIGETEEHEVYAADGETTYKTNIAPAAYTYCMREGGEIYMIIRLNSLSEFLGITLSMDNQVKDEWQLDGIQIHRIDDLSKRKMRTIADINSSYAIDSISNTATVNGVTVDRVYYRDVTGDILYAENDMDLLIQKGGSITHKFTDEGKEDKQEIYVRNYSEYYYSMDWETANKDLGFTLPTKSYTVMVDVPSNLSAGTTDDGTGSRNLFYFQLVFKNGKSGYVLANTQLQSDGFVAGATSTFVVCTNEDYGDVVSVNIIPDDIDENSDKLDKLCISKISIVKDNKNGINKTFVIDDDFWVTTEYRTQDIGSLYGTKIGRKEGDLVVNKIVESNAYMLTYEFAITTAKYQPGQSQFEGQVLATIAYYNSKGETKYIYDHDIVQAMYNYRNETWVTDNDKGWMSDPNKMFRGDTTDRFKINIDDAIGLESITFKIKSKAATTWTIKEISVGIITSEGVLYVNQNSEMQMRYQNELDPQLLVDKVINHDLPYSMTLAGSDTWDAFEYQFDSNAVPNIGNENEKISVIERIPSSANDTANIYVYLPKTYGALDNTYPDVNGYKIYGELYYEGSHYSYKNKTELRTALQPDGSMILFATGINAQNFVTLSNLKIYADVIRDVNHKYYDFVNYAVVQQVRGDTVVDTYTVHYNFQDIMQGPINMIGSESSISRNSYQELFITFDSDTVAAQLNPMNYDVAVSLRYTTTNDPANAGRVYHSPYIFLTDQNISSIQAGKTIKLQFQEDYVKDIVGVDMISTGGIKAYVENGYLNLYKDGLNTPSASYGIYEGGEILHSGTLYPVKVSDGETHSITPVEITFVTEDAKTTEITGTTEPVTIAIKYKAIDGTTKTKTYKNAQLYLGEGQSFKTGMTAKMNLNLVDFEDFRTITITPTDSWYVKSVTTMAEGQAGEKSIVIDKRITNSEPLVINFASIKVKANAITDTDNKTTENGTIEVNATQGTTVKIKVDCDGSLENNGYKAVIEKVTANGNEQVGEDIMNPTPIGTIELDLPSITSGEEENYVVTITSLENTSLVSTVKIKSHK